MNCTNCHSWGQTPCPGCLGRLKSRRKIRNRERFLEVAPEAFRARGHLPPPESDAEVVDDYLHFIEDSMPRCFTMSGYIPRALINELIEAALDQPNPSDRLKEALTPVLINTGHSDRDRTVEVECAA